MVSAEGNDQQGQRYLKIEKRDQMMLGDKTKPQSGGRDRLGWRVVGGD